MHAIRCIQRILTMFCHSVLFSSLHGMSITVLVYVNLSCLLVCVCVSLLHHPLEWDLACQCGLLLCSCRTSLGAISWAQCSTVRVRLLFSRFSSPCTRSPSLPNCPSSSLTSFILIWFLTPSTYLRLSLCVKFSPALSLHRLLSSCPFLVSFLFSFQGFSSFIPSLNQHNPCVSEYICTDSFLSIVNTVSSVFF